MNNQTVVELPTINHEVYDKLKTVNKSVAVKKEFDDKKNNSLGFLKSRMNNINIPENFLVDETGILMLKQSKNGDVSSVDICGNAIIVDKIYVDSDDNTQKTEISYFNNRTKKWISNIYNAEDLANASACIIELAKNGASVDSSKAKYIADYIRKFRDANINNIETSKIVNKIGWKDNDKVFCFPQNTKTLDEYTYSNDIIDKFKSSENDLSDYYIETFKKVYNNNVYTKLSIAASLASPFLKLTNTPNFTLYFWGNSGWGKTAIMQFALAGWCDPSKNMITYNSTTVGLERSLSENNDIATLIDERQSAVGSKQQQQQQFEQLIYMIEKGCGKIRGKKDGGLRKTSSFRTIVLSNGEEPILGDTAKAGSLNRCVEIHVEKDIVDKKMASELYRVAQMSYGNFAINFLNKVLENEDKKTIQKKVAKINEYISNLSNDEKSMRQVSSISLLALINEYVCKYIYQMNNEEVVKSCAIFCQQAVQSLKNKSDIDDTTRAVNYIDNYIFANSSYIVSAESADKNAYQKKLGFSSKDNNGKTVYYLLSSELKNYLRNNELSFQKTMTGLAEMGLIERKYNRYNISCKIKGTDVKGTFIIYQPAPDVDVEVEQEISDDDELSKTFLEDIPL